MRIGAWAHAPIPPWAQGPWRIAYGQACTAPCVGYKGRNPIVQAQGAKRSRT